MNFKRNTTYIALLTALVSMVLSVSAQVRPYRVTDRQVQNLLSSIESKTDIFRRQMDAALDNNRRWNNTQREENVTEYITNFENATDELKNNFDRRTSTDANVREVLNRAMFINNFMMNNRRVSQAAQNQWSSIRTDLNTLSNYYRVSWNWNNQVPVTNRAYFVTDAEVQTLLARLETRGDTFRRQADRWVRNSRYNNNENLSNYIDDFENATDSLKRNFDERDSVAGDVEAVLQRGAVIDRFVRANRMNGQAEREWRLIRNDLSTLANYYRVSWNWNSPVYPTFPTNSFDSRLTGTYRINLTQSDNVPTVVSRAISNNNYNSNQRDRVQRNLERRLTSPDVFVIEKNGQTVLLGSSLSQQVSLNADGIARSETNDNGRTIETRVKADNNDLQISYEGDRMNDFYVTFMPMSNGQLRVTRKVYLENRNELVTATSVYDKIDNVARWNNVNTRPNYPTDTTGNVYGDFVVPNNTQIVARLNEMLSTKTMQDGERFTMTVTSPSQYRGAIIEGRVVGDKSGVVSGRATMTLEFDSIRLTNGSTYRFAGIVDQVREPDGDNVSINNEGTIRDGSQTTKTATRAGIGAALGAIIGAIAGGGKGALIGAGIGAGAGAGSVVLQGRDNLELPNGTEFNITATSPTNVGYNR